MRIEIPDMSFVILIGASGTGKSTFIQRHFRETEVVLGVEESSSTSHGFEVVELTVEKRLKAGQLTVIDATELDETERKRLIKLSKRYHMRLVGIFLTFPERGGLSPNQISKQVQRLEKIREELKTERFHHFYTLTTQEEMKNVVIDRTPLEVDLRAETGPFDLIGDVHGCFTELCLLLERLGYRFPRGTEMAAKHPTGRKVVFVGDLVDRGPDSPRVLQLVMNMVEAGDALVVRGNHDERLLRKLSGKNVQLQHGLQQTLEQFAAWPHRWRARVSRFLYQLPHHYVLDHGRLVVAHAGLIEAYHGRSSGKVWSFAVYGDKTGEVDEYGFPIRRNWAGEYRGEAWVVYGHTPVETPVIQNRTINIDTGCVFGGKLTALRYPEHSFVSVKAQQTYSDFARPFFTQADFTMN